MTARINGARARIFHMNDTFYAMTLSHLTECSFGLGIYIEFDNHKETWRTIDHYTLALFEHARKRTCLCLVLIYSSHLISR